MLENTTAVLVIWHDLLPEAKIEWEQWHTHEHMPERVGIPGFLGGRRYMNVVSHCMKGVIYLSLNPRLT